jgi:hypothetical protein
MRGAFWRHGEDQTWVDHAWWLRYLTGDECIETTNEGFATNMSVMTFRFKSLPCEFKVKLGDTTTQPETERELIFVAIEAVCENADLVDGEC